MASVFRTLLRRERERRGEAGHSGVHASQRDPLHETVYGTDRDSYSRPAPHTPQRVTLGDDPHATVTANPAVSDPNAELLRRYL